MIKRLIRKLRGPDPGAACADATKWQLDIISRVQPFTMTSKERILATINATEYLVRHDISGALVECGVWRGGNMMAAAFTLLELGATRPLHLFDTFTGMTQPETVDKDVGGLAASLEYAKFKKNPRQTQWCEASIDEVRINMASTGYSADLVHFVEGAVESTLPTAAPERIALLRLDTDWYASTRHELEHLYPRVSSGGVVAIDDYGHWQGARQAVDEYLASNRIRCLLHRIDYTAREFVKP
jgi:O-methyltransferase